MTLSFAERCAARLVEWLTPHAVRVEVAGSIRRRRETVGDVDLVVIPSLREEKDIFGNVASRTNATREDLLRRAAADGWAVSKDGPDIAIVQCRGVQVDVYWGAQETWGTLLLCRTGSREHNIWLADLALARGGKWHPYIGLGINHRVVCATEEEIYAALGLPLLDPATQRDFPALARIRPKPPTS